MRIDTLQLQNVRALKHFETTFQPQFNLIVGKNATGKTTLLEIIARILSQWTPTPKALLQREDPHEEIRNGESDPYKKVLGPCCIAVSGQGPDGTPFSGMHTLPHRKKTYCSILSHSDETSGYGW
jgi:energy-coupling factor transporter ATP-binding protein EcfA2